MTTPLYAIPRTISDVSDCLFYHKMDLPEIGTVDGRWDLRGRLADYSGGVEVAGKRVLDVGCATGFLSFEFEKLGAQVVSFDVGSADDMDRLPFSKSLYSTNRTEWAREVDRTIEQIKNSYWFCHGRYRSQAKAYYGDVYNLPSELGLFDVVMVGQILVHLKDPLSAISELAKKCTGTIIVTEGIIDSDNRIMGLCADPAKGPDWSWWHLSTGLYKSILKIMGFEVVSIESNVYNSQRLGPTSLGTVVARRNATSDSGIGFGPW
jgi:SAM-dependent methyltransferase